MARKKRPPVPSDVSGSSRPPKKRKTTSCFSEDTAGHSKLELETMNHKIEELEMMMFQRIEELQTEINELKEKLNILENPTATNQISEQVVHDRYKLRIEVTIKKGAVTRSKVEGKNGELLEEAIYSNGEKITSGPLAPEKIEILVIKGDLCASNRRSWNSDIYQQSLVTLWQDVGWILKDTYMSEFANGEAVLDGLNLIDNSSWVGGKKWRLGSRLLDTNGVRVLEAISDCFRVLDRNGKDGVEGRKNASDLQEKKICTIKDFLQLFHTNSSCLFQILGVSLDSDESGITMIGHAKECGVGPNLYSYRNNSNTHIFDSVYAFLQMLTYSQSSHLSEAYITEVLNIHNDKPPVNITSEWNNDNARNTLKVVCFVARLLLCLSLLGEIILPTDQ